MNWQLIQADHLEAEKRNPYYVDHLFKSVQSAELEQEMLLSHFSEHTEVKTYDVADPVTTEKEEPEWKYEGISSNANGECCYQFDLSQWPANGNRKLLACVFIPLGLFHKQSIYLPWSEQLAEDHPLIPSLKKFLEGLGQNLPPLSHSNHPRSNHAA